MEEIERIIRINTLNGVLEDLKSLLEANKDNGQDVQDGIEIAIEVVWNKIQSIY